MTKKELSLVALVVLMAGVYVFFFSGWFKDKPVNIHHTVRPIIEYQRRSATPPPPGPRKQYYSVTFALEGDMRFNDVKVVNASEIATNKYAHPIWELVSEKGSEPTQGFTYGGPIPGMTPKVRDATPDPVESGIRYRLVLQSGKKIFTHDFSIADLDMDSIEFPGSFGPAKEPYIALKPVHRNARNYLFFDMHVGAKKAGDWETF